MNQGLDHERCSELLRDHVRGRLGETEGDAVARHLGECTQCRLEYETVKALVEARTALLTPSERAALRARVEDEVGRLRSATGDPRHGKRWRAVLAAAAAIGVVAVGASALDLGPAQDQASQVATGDADAPEAGREALEASAPEAGAADVAVPFATTFVPDAGKITERELKRLGKRGFARGTRSDALAATAGGTTSERQRGRERFNTYREPLLQRLLAKAPSEDEELVRRCAQTVFESTPDGVAQIVPVYAAFGRLDASPALVLGFLWSDERAGPLDHYMVWAWPRGSCDIPLLSAGGPLR